MYLECMVSGTYIGNARFRAFPMYCYSSFSRRYIGIEISMPIPMYGCSNLSIIYIGMGQHRLFPMYRQKLPKQNTSEFQVFIQSRCISINFPRIYLHPLAAYSRANQPHFNLPRFSCLTYGLGQFFMAFKTSSLRSRARSFIRGFAPEDESMVDIILLLIS